MAGARGFPPLHPGRATEVEIKIAARPLGDGAQQLRIQIIGSDLERLDAVTLDSGPGQKCKAEKGFTAAAGRCCDHNGHGVGLRLGEQPGSQGRCRRQEWIGAVVATAQKPCHIHFRCGLLNGHNLLDEIEISHAAAF